MEIKVTKISLSAIQLLGVQLHITVKSFNCAFYPPYSRKNNKLWKVFVAQTSFKLFQIQGLKCIQFGMLNVHFPGLL